MRSFVLTNTKQRISDDDAARIVQASSKELVNFCAAWSLAIPTLRYCPTGVSVQASDDVIDLADSPPVNESGVLGEHTEISGQRRGTIYAGYELDNGGKALALDGSEPPGATTVASIFFHELAEQLVNGDINAWWDGPITVGGQVWSSVASEVADPVEDGVVRNVADDGAIVWLSNYVLSAWQDIQAVAGPFDALGALSGPFTVSGYVVVRNGPGTETPVFPAGYPAHRRALKEWQWRGRLGD
jgi:hypothetical protein